MIAQLINRDCTLHKANDSGTADDYGNVDEGYELVETVCELQQTQRTEPGDQGELSDTRWVAFFRPDEDMGGKPSANKLEVEGNVYEFVGAPWLARNPRTQVESHIEATLRYTKTVVAGS